jgi:hypothetical protein
MKLAGSEHEITWTVTEHDAPQRVVLDGVADTFTSQEDIRVEPGGRGHEGDLHRTVRDRHARPARRGGQARVLDPRGKVVIRHLRDTVEEQTGDDR